MLYVHAFESKISGGRPYTENFANVALLLELLMKLARFRTMENQRPYY